MIQLIILVADAKLNAKHAKQLQVIANHVIHHLSINIFMGLLA